jgi:ubiquinone/menaquinone biosynthesis C-methylase UbiE
MDDLSLDGPPMKELLNDLCRVNKWLGGNRITIDGITKLLNAQSKRETITILDVGCGDGEMLRACARYGDSAGLTLQLIGVDANENILNEAKERSRDLENISFKRMDVFSEELVEVDFDIALCSLFLHHFSDTEIIQILNKLIVKSKIGVVVNDLHRSRLAFGLFKLFGIAFLKTPIARHDGLVSIARSFKRKELEQLIRSSTNEVATVKWKWAFRYQGVLKKTK